MNATGENEAILTGDSLSFSEFFIFLFLLFSSSFRSHDGVFCSFEFLKKKRERNSVDILVRVHLSLKMQ